MRSDKKHAGSERADDKFEWDMTAVVMLVLLISILVAVVMSVGPLGHTR